MVFIGILDFEFFVDDADYITRHRTVNVKTQRSTLNGMEYNFIELEKFNKELKDIRTLVDKWIYFLKNAPNLDVIPADVKDKGLKYAYEDADKHSWTKDELHAYDYAAMRKQDEKGKITKAEKKGRDEREIEMIVSLHKNGASLELISKSSNLTIKKVKEILTHKGLL